VVIACALETEDPGSHTPGLKSVHTYACMYVPTYEGNEGILWFCEIKSNNLGINVRSDQVFSHK
jgi:hypothetical protein